ncbi:DNA-3-methyladenine glycosylase I [Methanolobus bombayensis]|uniref:DNA-3-methyladenine glycosylase I n=1 Tax=Methanolobus bombayensis TaxID=38023 RepID=UPI001AE6C241|nr:DNA-3-methyladenine glycosylase I [Methanolobus bombayensis]MBP1909631.1 DNA-3-methyladenine glycosylase I [Methanolobus bombayensis]
MDTRCEWAEANEHEISYHDTEWGVPEHDDRKLFEFLILEGAQAGLSWDTILKRRENYRKSFDDFDFEKVATYDEKKISQLLQDSGIIRNKLKVRSAVNNAKVFIQIRNEFCSFDAYLKTFLSDGKPIQNSWKSMQEIPAKTELSEKISKDMKKRGFNFVGPTIIYAFMQAVGMVNDHVVGCFRYEECRKMH